MDYQNEKMILLHLLKFIQALGLFLLPVWDSGIMSDLYLERHSLLLLPTIPAMSDHGIEEIHPFNLQQWWLLDKPQSTGYSKKLLYQMTCRKPGMPPRCLINSKSLARVLSSLPATSAHRIQRLHKPQLLFWSMDRACTHISLCLLFSEGSGCIFHQYVLQNRLIVQQKREGKWRHVMKTKRIIPLVLLMC